MTDNKKQNPINLPMEARRNLYLANRRQIEKSKTESLLLPDFDRLHTLKHQEFPRLHEFRLGWLCGRSYERENTLLSGYTLPEKETITLSLDTYQDWVDGILKASAEINQSRDTIKSLTAIIAGTNCKSFTLDQEIERLR